MREIIAVCRSGKKSRLRTAKVLDRYFWRIGDRTWRGKATNACLDRVARELRAGATRNTAVVIHEVRSSIESRVPIIRIGSRSAFSDEGLVPVSSHPASVRGGASIRPAAETNGMAAVRIAALFHDLGKATVLFQEKLRRAMKGGEPEADAVRHELFSAAVWDDLCGDVADADLSSVLVNLSPARIDASCRAVIARLGAIHSDPASPLPFSFIGRPGSLSHLIGMLTLTHHRLPSGSNDHVVMTGERHVRSESVLIAKSHLAIASGSPFWHDAWWVSRLRREAGRIVPGSMPASADIALRASIMFADHLGSALSERSETSPDHLANTTRIDGSRKADPADSLLTHVRRVYGHSRAAHDLTHRLRDRFPAIDFAGLPVDVAAPAVSSNPNFSWQGVAAAATKDLCSAHEGGFFACIMSGTGTGKTRAAPTILASAAMHDARPERRYFRMTLGLGLRVLATQSAREYVEDLGFQEDDVSVMIGQEPVLFAAEDPESSNGSESLVTIPDWLYVARAGTRIPDVGDPDEDGWLRSLSLNTERGIPAFLEMILEKAGKNSSSARRLLESPIIVGTIDHLMGVASPVNSRFLLQSLRILTSDLILDEIDQYDGEDIAAIGRLVFQTGAAGRRVVIMSATLTLDIAEALEAAYRNGWAEHARASSADPHVNLLVCGDAHGAVFTNDRKQAIGSLVHDCQQVLLAALRAGPKRRRAEILPPCETWDDLVAQIDAGCSRLHDLNAVDIDGFRVSVGMVRMTRISHTVALAAQIRSRNVDGRLRLIVCLHSQMPRLHRAYIEMRLRLALNRNGSNPDAGVRRLCEARGVFEKAAAANVRDIEIVVITSPVIETGNDLDFDYGVIDPISTRSIIQSAGRVMRHRLAGGAQPNIFILGRSPVAMHGGLLAMPGVETRPARETLVPRRDLGAFEGRLFAELAGDETFSSITAAPLFDSGIKFPLRDAEAGLCKLMVSVGQTSPLGRYISFENARWNLTMTKTRRFRRSETGEICFYMIGECLEDSGWYIDMAPGTRNSALRAAGDNVSSADLPASALFRNLTVLAWQETSSVSRDMGRSDLRNLLQVSAKIYDRDAVPQFTYNELTGFTRGSPDDLFGPFGKSQAKQ